MIAYSGTANSEGETIDELVSLRGIMLSAYGIVTFNGKTGTGVEFEG